MWNMQFSVVFQMKGNLRRLPICQNLPTGGASSQMESASSTKRKFFLAKMNLLFKADDQLWP